MLNLFIAVLLGYLIGSIPTGYLIVKAKTGQDIRTIGSGSTGATNVKRVLGKEWFFVTMLLDANKGALPVVIAMLLLEDIRFYGLASVLAAVAVLVGHSKSIFLNFTGGKSVAAGIGTILALHPGVGIIVALTWAIITWFSKYVSLGSMIAVSLSPFLMWAFHKSVWDISYCAIGAVFIIWLHRENIKRLINGTENKVR